MDMLHEEGQSINRNIVECKVQSGRQYCQLHSVLIETSWNIK